MKVKRWWGSGDKKMIMSPDQTREITRDLENELKGLYPNLEFGNSHLSSYNEKVASHIYDFKVDQKALNGLEYQLNEEKEFIHYTSLEALFGIIHTQKIRLYNLFNQNDPFEFNYLLNNASVGLSEMEINKFKKSLFLLCFCRYSEILKDDFNLWRLYGNNGNGVGIVFELENIENEWSDFLIGKVLYGTSNAAYKKLDVAIEIINNYINNKGLQLDRLPKLIGYLLLFHKHDIWSVENEYRLMGFLEYDKFYQPINNYSNPFERSLRPLISKTGIETAFIEFPLSTYLEEGLIIKDDYEAHIIDKQVIPKLRIKKVVLGYNISEKTSNRIKELLLHYSVKKIHNLIPVEHSRFTSLFQG